MEQLKCKTNKYPEVKQLRKNSYYCGLLQNLYAGADSETSSFLQFRYQAYQMKLFNNELFKIFEEFSIQDLKHQELLANAIIMLGGDPIFSNSEGKWFGGRSVDYVKDTKQMLLLNIESREKFIIDYKTAISKIENNEIKSLLKVIVKDEEKQKKALEGILKKINDQ